MCWTTAKKSSVRSQLPNMLCHTYTQCLSMQFASCFIVCALDWLPHSLLQNGSPLKAFEWLFHSPKYACLSAFFLGGGGGVFAALCILRTNLLKWLYAVCAATLRKKLLNKLDTCSDAVYCTSFGATGVPVLKPLWVPVMKHLEGQLCSHLSTNLEATRVCAYVAVF